MPRTVSIRFLRERLAVARIAEFYHTGNWLASRLLTMRRCPECETEVFEDVNFCPQCGASVKDEPAKTEEEAQAAVTTAEAFDDPGTKTGVSDSVPSAKESKEPTQQDRVEHETTSLEGRFWINALIGGIVGFVVAMMLVEVFFPIYFLGIVGGALLSGWLHGRGTGQGAKVGGVAGFLATVPFAGLLVAVVLVGFGGFLVAEPAAAEFAQEGELLAALGVLSAVLIVIAFVANVIFGVIGGLVGGALVGE